MLVHTSSAGLFAAWHIDICSPSLPCKQRAFLDSCFDFFLPGRQDFTTIILTSALLRLARCHPIPIESYGRGSGNYSTGDSTPRHSELPFRWRASGLLQGFSMGCHAAFLSRWRRHVRERAFAAVVPSQSSPGHWRRIQLRLALAIATLPPVAFPSSSGSATTR